MEAPVRYAPPLQPGHGQQASDPRPRLPRLSLFARTYDLLFARIEKAGLADRRRELLANAHGAVIDIGAGTGVNLEHYPVGLERLVLAEPDETMARQIEGKPDFGTAEVAQAPAEKLPFPDDSFDTAVFTLVLCTVPDPAAALAEARRVLKPGGKLLFMEHVRSDSDRVAGWQDRLERPWGFLFGGCHPNRATAGAIEASGFRIEELSHGEMRKAGPLTKPLISGIAR